MGFSKKQTAVARQRISASLVVSSNVLDATKTTDILVLQDPFKKISFQATGSLAGTVEFSIDGIHFFGSVAIPGANAPASYEAHNVVFVKVTRTSGSGTVVVAAV